MNRGQECILANIKTKKDIFEQAYTCFFIYHIIYHEGNIPRYEYNGNHNFIYLTRYSTAFLRIYEKRKLGGTSPKTTGKGLCQ